MKLSTKKSKKTLSVKQDFSLNALKKDESSPLQLGYSESTFNFLISTNSDLVMLITEPEEEKKEG